MVGSGLTGTTLKDGNAKMRKFFCCLLGQHRVMWACIIKCLHWTSTNKPQDFICFVDFIKTGKQRYTVFYQCSMAVLLPSKKISPRTGHAVTFPLKIFPLVNSYRHWLSVVGQVLMINSHLSNILHLVRTCQGMDSLGVTVLLNIFWQKLQKSTLSSDMPWRVITCFLRTEKKVRIFCCDTEERKDKGAQEKCFIFGDNMW